MTASVYSKIERLLHTIDAFASNSNLQAPVFDIAKNYERKELGEKTMIQTPLGKGYILGETSTHYLLDMVTMVCSIVKSQCVFAAHRPGCLVDTPLGQGIVLESDSTFCVIQMQNMVASIATSQCSSISSDNHRGTDKQISLRDVRDIDLSTICDLEQASYPSDEAASKENLYYRFIFAHPYFKVFSCNGKVCGFVCATKTDSAKLTHDAMSVHSKNGTHLCIHSVVIEAAYRRQGYGLRMMKMYVKQQLAGQDDGSRLSSIRLVCKQYLITFYSKAGFRLIGESDLVHGKDKWFEMAIECS